MLQFFLQNSICKLLVSVLCSVSICIISIGDIKDFIQLGINSMLPLLAFCMKFLYMLCWMSVMNNHLKQVLNYLGNSVITLIY